MAFDSFKKFALRLGPAIFLMGLIFVFSSIPGNISPPSVLPSRLTPYFLIRKSGHLLGYALLAIALISGLRPKSWKEIVAIMGCVLLFALSDELHQSFVPGRTASLIDVSIDLIGITMGLVCAFTLGIVHSDVLARD